MISVAMQDKHAIVQFAGNDFFVATTPSGHSQVIDFNGIRNSAVGPLEMLLIALGGCTGADVISILNKKREPVTAYHLEIRGERREEHPKSFRRIEVKHVVRGKGVSREAVEHAVTLSTEKYCSVAATLRPTAEIVPVIEILEE
jgi:putative redox protein